ncbi:MAG: prepilin-type N-terminal cleavage/methylation domain-containing protein, partial [Zavarzinia sp.]|nr:prepilin-type N-terminal cleavage/methylation domain-containing protein [Zavarzinia sp.]
MTRRDPIGRQRGVTLVESLVALALLALVALLMVQGVATGGAVLGGTMRRAGVEEGIEGAQALLRERITSA